MKSFTYFLTLFCVVAFSSLAIAQATHTVDFEPAGVGADWNWEVSENGDNPPLEFIANPVSGGINTSATVAKFTARQAGNPWALFFTSDDGSFTFDASNAMVKIMLYKTELSDVGFKVEGASGDHQIIQPNTLINQWEEMTFDFSGQIGNTYGKLVILPDWQARAQDNIVYIDNIQVPDGVASGPVPQPIVKAPDPIHINVFSIYSDAYTNLDSTNFNPSWGQATVVTHEMLEGNNTLKYTGLNYQGTNLGSEFGGVPQDVSGYTHLHVDFWTANAAALNFFVLDQSPGEIGYSLPITAEQWVSVDIPLSYYSNGGENLADIHQFKVDGGDGVITEVWFDNWYFHSGEVSSIDEISGTIPSEFSLEQNYPNPFNPSTKIRFSIPKANHVSLKVFNMLGQEVATLVDNFKNAGTYEVNFDAKNLPTGTYFYSISAGSFSSIQKMLLIK